MVTDTLEATADQAIEVRRVRPDPEQPRKTFDEEALQELARSLSSNGLLQPIVVRPDPEGNAGDYLLIAGERRWRAAGILGWDTIPALIRDDVTASEAAKLQLLENIVRRDLNPVEEARAFQKMIGEGFTVQELGKAVGLPVAQITWRVQMLNAREDILHMVAKGHLKPAVAHELSKLSYDGQNRALRAINSEKLTYNEVLGLCAKIHAEENQLDMFPETKLTAEQQRAARTFGDAFHRISSVLLKLHRMEEESPGLLAKALAAESGPVEVQLSEAIKGLNRVRKAIQTQRVQEMPV